MGEYTQSVAGWLAGKCKRRQLQDGQEKSCLTYIQQPVSAEHVICQSAGLDMGDTETESTYAMPHPSLLGAFLFMPVERIDRPS